MARSATKPQTTAITDWEADLARDAAISKGMEKNVGGPPAFKITSSGMMSLDDVPIPDNRMAVVVLDAILENRYFEGKYDPDEITPPTCFAMGRDEDTLAPHESVVARGQAQHETCHGCPMNAFGSADTGRGKACQNRRRLLLIPAGELGPDGRGFKPYADPAQFSDGAAATFLVPPTSLRGYAGFVKQVANVMNRPPHAVFARISSVPDAKTQYKLTFEPLDAVPNALVPILMKRHRESAELIERPYNLEVEEKPAPAAKGRGKPPARRAAKY